MVTEDTEARVGDLVGDLANALEQAAGHTGICTPDCPPDPSVPVKEGPSGRTGTACRGAVKYIDLRYNRANPALNSGDNVPTSVQ
ncbi:hypothetical protein GCM10010293_62450 [Streptomyces griseoflavus]|nr:hypothetical protein GCM10010293_62450 [Streptomyces griseoflavus]